MAYDLPDDLGSFARAVVDANRYLVLGTTEPDGGPRVSPVYFTHHAYRDLYWVSEPTAHHSVNVRQRPDVAIVIFDSTAAVGDGRAVYLGGHAVEIGEADLPEHCALAWSGPGKGARPFTPAELSGDGDLRLYCATVTSAEIHVRGGDPRYGAGIDRRRAVDL